MKKSFQPITKILEQSMIDHLLNQADNHQESLQKIRSALSNTSLPISITPQDILSCQVNKSQIMVICTQASKATIIANAIQMVLPTLQQEYPNIFPSSIKKSKVLIQP